MVTISASEKTVQTTAAAFQLSLIINHVVRLSLTVSYPRLGGINRLTPGTLVLKKGETAEIGYQILLPEPLTDVVLLPYPAAYDGSIIRLTDTTDRGGGRQTVRLQGLAPGRTKVTLSFRNVTGGPQIVVTTTVTVTE